MPPTAPRVSILIPNFNNGRSSSHGGQTDFMADLLRSLHDTLADDPTPLEILAHDDGSTDDSLATLRDGATRTWRGGQRFLELEEAEHCGVLSVTANRLVRRARGEVLVRLDGDIEVLTPRWAQKLCRVFDQMPEQLGVVGPKQLMPDGRIHAFGDWLLHPKGYHHIAAGLPREVVTRPMEVDHVMGCFYCFKRRVWDELGGFDEGIMRGQTVDFGMRARLTGWGCVAVPQIEFIHRHGMRAMRATRADTPEGIGQTLETFRAKWGFDRVAPDLDVVRQRYRGTPLLWNAEVFAAEDPDPAEGAGEAELARSQWQRYSEDENLRKRTDLYASLIQQVTRQTSGRGTVAVVGCGDGLLLHLLARQGLSCVGVDRHEPGLKLGRRCVSGQDYPVARPRLVCQRRLGRLPLPDGDASMVVLLHQLESHPNPVGLLHETHRVTAEDGVAVLITLPAGPTLPGLGDGSRRYLPHELMEQVRAVGGWQPMTDPRDVPRGQPLTLVLRKAELSDGSGAAEAAVEPAVGAASGQG